MYTEIFNYLFKDVSWSTWAGCLIAGYTIYSAKKEWINNLTFNEMQSVSMLHFKEVQGIIEILNHGYISNPEEDKLKFYEEGKLKFLGLT